MTQEQIRTSAQQEILLITPHHRPPELTSGVHGAGTVAGGTHSRPQPGVSRYKSPPKESCMAGIGPSGKQIMSLCDLVPFGILFMSVLELQTRDNPEGFISTKKIT